MNTVIFKLEKYRGRQTRHSCPGCGKKEEFTLYIDPSTGLPINERVGLCNRRDSCGYHFTPKQFFDATGIKPQRTFIDKAPEPVKGMFTIPIELMERSLTNYTKNYFAMGLVKVFGEQAVTEMLQRYECIGTSTRYPGSVIFWQIDQDGNVRTGQIQNYDPSTLKRVKDSPRWAHGNSTNIPDHQELRQCFFGQHLLRDTDKLVAVTEAAKTAIICSILMPEFLWLAAGGLEGLGERKMQALRGRRVTLFPDLGKGSEVWKKKAEEYRHIADIKVSGYLEKIATEEQRANGLDAADFLLAEYIKDHKSQEHISGLSLSPDEMRDFISFCDELNITPGQWGEESKTEINQ